MGTYFDKFPKIRYDIIRDGTPKYVTYTNLLVRTGIREAIKNNMFSYYDYVVPEGMSIEILAERYYGNPQFHWVIMMANDMADPHHDWPLGQLAFNKFIVAKYGSIATAKITPYKYTKTISRFHIATQTTDTTILDVTETVYDGLAASSLVTYNLEDGTSVEETITRGITYAYDYEVALNEEKRNIKLIKREYLPAIKKEFDDLMFTEGNTSLRFGLRTLRNF